MTPTYSGAPSGIDKDEATIWEPDRAYVFHS